jgi:alkaline phosphatase D
LRSATSDSFDAILKKKVFVDVLPETDYTTKVVFNGLPLGQDMFYRVTLQDLFEPPIRGEPMIGRFRTAPADRRNVTFCWSGDTAGQGWGIDESRGGGMTIYSAIARNRPDFFIHSGDNIYADGPIPAGQKLPNGETWKNITTEKSRSRQKRSPSSAALTNTMFWTRTCLR